MANIVTVYNTERSVDDLSEMAKIRWHHISLALARQGHTVDIATAEHKWRIRKPVVTIAAGVRRVPISRVRWTDYDVVKTLFHLGFETLERFGGAAHPFIIAKLGSVVGSTDMEGIYFYGEQRKNLYETQERIARSVRYVTVLTNPARDLWVQCFAQPEKVLIVPGAAPRDIPAPAANPYPQDGKLHCLFAGNFYHESARSQSAAHRTLVAKLNELGQLLGERNARLYVLGPGTAEHLNIEHVTYLGTASYDASWNYLQHADVGVVVAAGPFNHNNESTKIYHYLRAGLPMVSEAGFPNDDVVRESGLGMVVPSGDMRVLADAVIETAQAPWDREAAVRYVLARHTWDARAAVYGRVIPR